MISDKQLKILAFPYSKYDCIICDGAIRTGKTCILMIAFIDWAMRTFNNQIFAICGKTVTTAYKNIIYPYMHLSYAYSKYKLIYTRFDHKLVVQYKGRINTFYLYGAKDISSSEYIQGLTLAGALFDEVVILDRLFVEQAIARCSVQGSKLFMSCNPDSPCHWFYKEWICDLDRHNALYIHFELEDNPSLSSEKIEWYKRQYTGRFYDKFIKGEWVQADGLVYDVFDPDKHVLSTEYIDDIQKTKNGYYYISIDYGITNPFAALIWFMTDECAYCVDEYYYSPQEHNDKRLTDEEHYKNVLKLASGYNISDIIIDPSANSFKEVIRRHDDFSFRGAKNAVLEGISYTTTLLTTNRLFISESCEHLINELELYSWDTDAQSDTVIKENDHACDSMRYFAFTVCKSEFDVSVDLETVSNTDKSSYKTSFNKTDYFDYDDDF